MANKKAMLNVSVAGHNFEGYVLFEDHPYLLNLISALNRAGIKFDKVDTVAGWGNLNQDWLEFDCEIETSWGWCRPAFLSDPEWDDFFNLLCDGKLLMMVHYRDADGKLESHH